MRHRRLVLLLVPALVALAPLAPRARADERSPALAVRVEGRATVLTRSVTPSAAPALGGLAGAVAGRRLRRLHTVAVLQGDPEVDARVRGERWVQVDGRQVPQRFDLRAEEVVVQSIPLAPEAGPPERLPVRTIYARGFVRLEVDLPGQGQYVIEAAEVYLDLLRDRAYVREGELRAQPEGGRVDVPLVLAAERLRLEGTDRWAAEGARVSICELGVPHLALVAERVVLEAPPDERGGPLLARMLDPDPDEEDGSDAAEGGLLARERERARWVKADGVSLSLFPPGLGLDGPVEVPVLPWFRWRTTWPIPHVRLGQSSQFGFLARVGLKRELVRAPLPRGGELRVAGAAAADHFSLRGTAGDLSLAWEHLAPSGAELGEGFVRAYGLRDRADEDRAGTPILHEGRYWLRGLLRERDLDGTRLDAELSRISDDGFLLEYFRDVALTEKEQETYVYLRRRWDDLGARIIGRWRLNEFQTQVERLPEARLDWISTPLAVHRALGGLYFDAATRAGLLRRQFDAASGRSSYHAARADTDLALIYKNAVGPLIARGEVGVRETVWSGRATHPTGAIDRFAARGAWSLSTTLWRTFDSPFGVLRHEIIPQVGTRHVFGVTRDPDELLLFDPDVERLEPTDHVFLRLRTRLVADVARRRRKLVDLWVEARYFFRDVGRDRARTWSTVTADLRLGLAPWLAVRARADHDVNAGRLRQLDVTLSARPLEEVIVSGSYHELDGWTQAVAWEGRLRLTPAWMVTFDQQYDLRSRTFLRHRARLIRFFHRLAVEVTFSHDPQQNDTAASFSIAPAWDFDEDPFAEDRYVGLDPGIW